MASIAAGNTAHVRRVCALYKSAMRNLEAHVDKRNQFRYRAILLRQRFEKNRNETDPYVINQLVENGEREVWETQHSHPKKFATSPGGVAYEREVVIPDWVLDFWHPLEKAQYPEYFARREQRKKEYIEWWTKQYGKPKDTDTHH